MLADGAGVYHFQVPDPVGNLIAIEDVNAAQDVTSALPAQHAAFGGRSGPMGLPFVRFGARWVFLGTGVWRVGFALVGAATDITAAIPRLIKMFWMFILHRLLLPQPEPNGAGVQ